MVPNLNHTTYEVKRHLIRGYSSDIIQSITRFLAMIIDLPQLLKTDLEWRDWSTSNMIRMQASEIYSSDRYNIITHVHFLSNIRSN